MSRAFTIPILAMAAVAVPGWAAADPPVCTQLDANTRACRIDRPVVNQRITDYPEIAFAAGDVVEVIAGGCVQTGGWGDTWKHYVNPRGDGSDERYFGTIQIPGVTAGLVRIAAVTSRKFRVPAATYLRLGYDDDGHGDNGYWERDPGTCSQCVGEPDAWIDLVIRKNAGFSNPVPRDMDLFWWTTDPNALPLNPHWWKRLMTGQAPDVTAVCDDFHYEYSLDPSCKRFMPACTSQGVDVDAPSQWDALCEFARWGAVNGHANYMPATYEGTIQWQDHSYWGDDDYNWRLYPVGGAGLTAGKTAIGVESDSEETIDRMGSPWWRAFHFATDATKRQLIDDKFAVVTGLMGFDCGHNPCSPELHPAYAMAIHVEDNPYDDQWAFYVSNYGNEGWCSSEDHPLDLSSLTLRLPRATAGATGTIVYDTVAINGNTSGPIRFVAGVGAELTFGMAPPASRGLTDGVVHVGWAPHPDYQTGAKIPAATTPCAADLAAIDPYCVNNSWDSICTREARDLCPSHSVCAAGAPLAKLESACVTRVCNADSYCCTNSWDSICVNEARSMCTYTCATGAP